MSDTNVYEYGRKGKGEQWYQAMLLALGKICTTYKRINYLVSVCKSNGLRVQCRVYSLEGDIRATNIRETNIMATNIKTT